VTSSRRDDDSPNLSGCPFATITYGPGITATTPRPFATITARAGGSVSISPALLLRLYIEILISLTGYRHTPPLC
jgi:hypothetical protein